MNPQASLLTIALYAALSTACGSQFLQTHEEEPRFNASQTNSLRAPPKSIISLATEEKSAIELAKLAQHRDISRSFRDYLILQERAHEELLKIIGEEYDLPYIPLSPAGAQMWSALQNRGGSDFMDLYFELQRPWQTAMLQRLHEEFIPASTYPEAAQTRWARDLAALKALTGEQ